MKRAARRKPQQKKPIRVAIIGGGCAGMTAAYELSRPEQGGRYEVTVYQVGHRLGGKGASGRDAHGRIEEHGLHLWMGYYENAFRMMRECYEALGRDERSCPIYDIESAFEPAPQVGLTERLPGGGWFPWLASFPMSDGMPGDPIDSPDPFTIKSYLVRAAELLAELIRSAQNQGDPRRGARRRPAGWSPDEASYAIHRALQYGRLVTAASLVEAAETFHAALAALLPSAIRAVWETSPLLRLADVLTEAAQEQIDILVDESDELRRVWEVVDILLALTRGVLRAGVAVRRDGLDALDSYDYREWLLDNGASPRSLDGAFLRGVYDLLFAYENGDPERPRFAAGVAVRGTLRMFFTYRGALFYRMNAGMGDVIFAPLYELLRRRGVKFAFFHRLRDVHVTEEGNVPYGEDPWITQLDFDVQAETLPGKEYEPLILVKGLPCWPSKPLFEQLAGGPELKAEGADFESHWDSHRTSEKKLEVGRDFDLAVLAVGLGAVPFVAPSLVKRSAKVRSMVNHIKTVATQAFQVWMTEDMRSLGWRGGRVNVSAFVEPFDTWADMTHLIRAEDWHLPLRSIAYFCSVLPDNGPPKGPEIALRARNHVKKNAIRHLEHEVRELWPHSNHSRGGFRWEILAGASEEAKGPARFDSQYWTANVGPSDRYVMSLPGTVVHRISPLDPGFSNFTFAGDWTETGLNSGCVESAVISGRLASHALSAYPHIADITGYDHP